MELQQAIQIIQSRKLVANPSKVVAKVTNIHLHEDRYIINLNLMSSYHFSEAKRLLKEAVTASKEGDDSTAEELIQQAVNMNVTANCRIDTETGVVRGFLPAKGEQIHAVLDEITTKNGVTGLFVTGISAMPVTAAKAINLSMDSLMSESPVEEFEEAEG